MYIFNEDGSLSLNERLREEMTSMRATGILGGPALISQNMTLSLLSVSEEVQQLTNRNLKEVAVLLQAERNDPNHNLAMFKDMATILTKLFVSEMQGFPGPLPVTYYRSRNSLATFTLYLPADGALLRYFQRMFNKLTEENQFLTARVVPMSSSGPTRVRVVNGHEATLQTVNAMAIVIDFTSENHLTVNRPVQWGAASLSEKLSTLKRVMQINNLLPHIIKVMRTLVRKMVSIDGSWGELPKFPIVNLYSKLSSRVFGRDVLLVHGNDRELFGDKEVYFAAAFSEKSMFTVADSEKEKFQWIDPK